MHVVCGGKLRAYYERPGREAAEAPLKAWHLEAIKARWQGPDDVASRYRTAVFFGQSMVAFAFCGGMHRLVTRINYPMGVVLVSFVGTTTEFTMEFGQAVA